MAEGYTRAQTGNLGVCIGTSGPAGTDMITGLHSAIADSILIVCITGQAPTGKLHKEDFQTVEIKAIAGAFAKWTITLLESAQVPRAWLAIAAVHPDTLLPDRLPKPPPGRTMVVGAGKAAAALELAWQEHQPEACLSGLVVTSCGHGPQGLDAEYRHVDVLKAAHPCPTI